MEFKEIGADFFSYPPPSSRSERGREGEKSFQSISEKAALKRGRDIVEWKGRFSTSHNQKLLPLKSFKVFWRPFSVWSGAVAPSPFSVETIRGGSIDDDYTFYDCSLSISSHTRHKRGEGRAEMDEGDSLVGFVLRGDSIREIQDGRLKTGGNGGQR